MNEFIQALAVYLLCVNLAAALLWLINAAHIHNGRRLVRLLAVCATLFTAVVYSLVSFGFYPNGLPPELGRPVTTLLSTALFGLALLEWQAARIGGKK